MGYLPIQESPSWNHSKSQHHYRDGSPENTQAWRDTRHSGYTKHERGILMVIDSALGLSLTMNPLLDVGTHTQIMTNVFIVLQQVIYLVIWLEIPSSCSVLPKDDKTVRPCLVPNLWQEYNDWRQGSLLGSQRWGRTLLRFPSSVHSLQHLKHLVKFSSCSSPNCTVVKLSQVRSTFDQSSWCWTRIDGSTMLIPKELLKVIKCGCDSKHPCATNRWLGVDHKTSDVLFLCVQRRQCFSKQNFCWTWTRFIQISNIQFWGYFRTKYI